jgi:hypothetical protein
LQVFCSDEVLTRGLAAKSGLSGAAALAAPDRAQAARAEKAAAKAGALIEVKTTSPTSLPWDVDAFDMVVIDDTHGAFAALSDMDRSECLREARRVLRPGGRVEHIARAAGEATVDTLLADAGFKPVRTLAERDGFRFVEGLKG